MANYVGDILAADTVAFSFNTRDSTGAPITLAGTPAISVYKRGSTTESTSGVTLTVDYDSRTGYHRVSIDTSSDGTFYSAASDFYAVITTGTVNSISVVGVEVGQFSIENRTQKANVTKIAGQTASASGTVTFPNATLASTTSAVGSVTGAVGSVTGAVGSVTTNVGIDWSNITNKTSTVALTGTTISTSQVAASVTGNVGGNVNGNVAGTVGSVTGSVGSVTGSVGSVTGNIGGDVQGKVIGGGASSITGSGVQASSVVGSVGSVSGSVGSVTGSVGSVAGDISGNINGKVLGGGSGTITGDGVRAASVTGSCGSVTGAVGSITGVTFPTNFSTLYIQTSTGYVTATNGGGGGGTGLTAAETRAALGMAAADLDTQLDAILAMATTGGGGVIGQRGTAGTATTIEADTGTFGKTGVTVKMFQDGTLTATVNTVTEVSLRPGVYSFSNPSLTGMQYCQMFLSGITQPFFRGWADCDISGTVQLLSDPIQGSSTFVAAVADSINATSITVTRPLSADGETLDLVRGDSYTSANGRSLSFTITGQTSLIGTVPHLRIKDTTADLATASAISSGTQTVTFSDISATQTTAIVAGAYRYQIRFLNGSDVATVIEGTANVTEGF